VKIVSFGSCLSRMTAASYSRMFGGKIISTVMHNRSDYFLGRYVTGDFPEIDIDHFISKISSSANGKSADAAATYIMKNQKRDLVGIHVLSRGLNIFDALDEAPDILIMDNYFDLSAKLSERDDGGRLFFKSQHFTELFPEWRLGALLSTSHSVRNFHSIIDWVKKKSPQTRVYFINFPHNTYGQDKNRVARHTSFEAAFDRDDVAAIPIFRVPKAFHGSVPQHFKEAQYCGYAGVIRGLEGLF
jgi:hypothetical protein